MGLHRSLGTSVKPDAPLSDTAPPDFTVESVSPKTGAVTNTSSGNLVLNTAAPEAGGSPGAIKLKSNGTEKASCDANGFAVTAGKVQINQSTGYISVAPSGTVPASGLIRVPSNQHIIYGKTTGGTDCSLMRWDGSDNIVLGDGANNTRVNMNAGGVIELQIGGTAGMKVDTNKIFIKETVGVPGTPSGGGHLYVEGGALKYKGTSGTITVIAPA